MHLGKSLLTLLSIFLSTSLIAACGTLFDGPGRPPLATLKQEHRTELVRKGPNPSQFDNRVPRGVEKITYESNGQKLMAWVMKPAIKGKRPAIVYAHGGDSLGSADADVARNFVNAGFLVILPSWRGENGNPGDYEMCYGEVDDAVAAVEYLATRSDVDPSLIFAVGHSIGGTIVLLAAESTDKLAKVAACGALTDMNSIFGTYPDPPFAQNRKEKSLRSAEAHIVDISCPILLAYGTDDRGERSMSRMAESFQRLAAKKGKKVELVKNEGTDHFTNLTASIPGIISFFTSR